MTFTRSFCLEVGNSDFDLSRDSNFNAVGTPRPRLQILIYREVTKIKIFAFLKKSSQKTFNRIRVNKFRATRVTHFFALVTLVFIAQVQQKPRFATLYIALLIAKWLRWALANHRFSNYLPTVRKSLCNV